MSIKDLSAKSRATIDNIAKANGIKPVEVLRYITNISSQRKVSRHLRALFVPVGV